jgi:ABC-2 type transport system permease protein
MIKSIKLFLLFSRYAFRSTVQHPIGAFAFLLGKILRFGMYFMFVYYLLTHTRFLAGYNLEQTIIFFLTFNIIDSTAQLFFREVYRFRPLVVNGELDTILVKPYHPFLRILVGGVDLLDFITLSVYVGLLIWFLNHTQFTGVALLTFIALIINGLIIATAFHILVLAMGILTTEVDHAVMIYRDITRLGTLPVDIYQEPLRSVFTFLLPIGVMMTFPVKSLFGLLSGGMIMVSFTIAIGMLAGSLIIWNRAIKKYQSWGG